MWLLSDQQIRHSRNAVIHLLNLFSNSVDMDDRSLKVGIVGYGHLGEFSSKKKKLV